MEIVSSAMQHFDGQVMEIVSNAMQLLDGQAMDIVSSAMQPLEDQAMEIMSSSMWSLDGQAMEIVSLRDVMSRWSSNGDRVERETGCLDGSSNEDCVKCEATWRWLADRDCAKHDAHTASWGNPQDRKKEFTGETNPHDLKTARLSRANMCVCVYLYMCV